MSYSPEVRYEFRVVQVRPRKYQPLWEELKQNLQVCVDLPIAHMLTPEQKHAQLTNIKKMVIKEKCLDVEWKSYYPNSLLTAELDAEAGTLDLTLTLNTQDITKLF